MENKYDNEYPIREDGFNPFLKVKLDGFRSDDFDEIVNALDALILVARCGGNVHMTHNCFMTDKLRKREQFLIETKLKYLIDYMGLKVALEVKI